MAFDKESEFEKALIRVLMTKGWKDTVLRYPTEQDCSGRQRLSLCVQL